LKLTDRIYLIGGGAYGYSAAQDCNMYMINCGKALAMIDTGGGRGVRRVVDNTKQMGLDIKNLDVVFNTHCHYDHIGGNHEIKRLSGCRIAAHEFEVEEIESNGPLTLYDMARQEGLEFEPTTVDVVLKGGQNLQVGDVNLEIVHTPGHTPGGICIVVKFNKNTCIFTGDTASAQGRLGWVNGPGCDLQEWKRSIKKLMDLEPDQIYPGHGVFVLSEALEHLQLLDDKMNAPWTTIVTSIG